MVEGVWELESLGGGGGVRSGRQRREEEMQEWINETDAGLMLINSCHWAVEDTWQFKQVRRSDRNLEELVLKGSKVELERTNR